MSYQGNQGHQGGFGQKDPYESAPQYGSYNPLMATFTGNNPVMRKQVGPTELNHQGYQQYPQEYYYEGQYGSQPSVQTKAPVKPGIQLKADTQAGQGFTNQGFSSQPGNAGQYAPGPNAQGGRSQKEGGAAASTKLPVESDPSYPSPHKPPSILSILLSDAGKFERILV